MTDEPPTSPPGWYPDASGQQRWWDGTAWTDNYTPLAPVSVNAVAPFQASVPGRTAGFVCGLIAILFVALPIVSIPLGIVGWVQSHKALRFLTPTAPGRGLAIAGQTLSIIALVLTVFIVIAAIPGAIRANFR